MLQCDYLKREGQLFYRYPIGTADLRPSCCMCPAVFQLQVAAVALSVECQPRGTVGRVPMNVQYLRRFMHAGCSWLARFCLDLASAKGLASTINDFEAWTGLLAPITFPCLSTQSHG